MRNLCIILSILLEIKLLQKIEPFKKQRNLQHLLYDLKISSIKINMALYFEKRSCEVDI